VLLRVIGNGAAHYRTYYYTFWATEGPSCLLALLVAFELFRKAFDKHLGLRQRGTDIFRISLVVLISIALLSSLLAPGSDSSRIIVGTLILQEVESLVLAGLAVALFAFVFLMGLPWSNYTVGIAAGFAVRGMAELVSWGARVHYGRVANEAFIWSMMAAAFCQTMIWAAYLLPRRSNAAESYLGRESELTAVATELDRLNKQVELLLDKQ
jgi:hypothetical protein